MIFTNPLILNTPALLRLGAVEVNRVPEDYQAHKMYLRDRVAELITKCIADDGKDNTCAFLTAYLGHEGLQECMTMTPFQIAEATILLTSAGAALLSDLRERWAKWKPSERGTHVWIGGFEEEYHSMTLTKWLETLVSEYVEIQ